MSDRRGKRREPRRNQISVEVACNDERGCFAHRAEMIQIGEIELEARRWDRPPRFVDLGDAFRLSGKVWAYSASTEYLGNWCWNGYRIESSAADFLIWLKGRNLFVCSAAPSELYDWWRAPAATIDRVLLSALLMGDSR